ncbi:N/A [soil metagenome]
MALTSTLYTGLSGLDVNQTRLNVVGNNIANANTTGFKSSRSLFQSQFYVTDISGSAPTSEFGGTNPSQRGLGATVATIEKDFTTGSIEGTGKPSDLAIDGEGFFVVQGVDQKFTRDGSFSLNSNNQLVTTGGDFVQGYGVDADNNVVPGVLQNIAVPLGQLTQAKATENVAMAGNLNANGTTASGASILNSQALSLKTGAVSSTLDGTTLLTDLASATTPATALFNSGDAMSLAGKQDGRTLPTSTFTVSPTSTVDDLLGFFNQGLGIDTTVAGTPTPGATIESIAGQTKLVVTGNGGTANALSLSGAAFLNGTGVTPLSFTDGQNSAGVVSSPTGESIHTSFVAYDSLGTPVTVDVTATLESKNDTGNVWRFIANSGDDTDINVVPSSGINLGNGTLTFDSDGKLKSSTGTTLSIDRTNTGSGTPITLKLDFSATTSLTSTHSTLVTTQQDGSPIGTLTSYSIGSDGTVTGAFSNGLTKSLAQVAIALFNNPNGLQDNGGNDYTVGSNSGLPIITSASQLGSGQIRSGSLELSNVDLSKEFINLIIASTGFSASSRVITTSDQLISELLNSAR